MADAFVDSMGVNIHLGDSTTLYGQFGTIKSLLTGLGVRHYRDGAHVGDSGMANEFSMLAAAGIKINMLSTEGEDLTALRGWVASLGSAVDSVEGPNEFDLSNIPSWWTILDPFQAALYPGIKSVSSVPVIDPSFAQAASFGQAGSFASDADENNMHDYRGGRNPGSPGWGATDAFGTYGSLAWNIGIASQLVPGKPIVATETGYSDATDPYAIPAATKARYTVRTFLEHWNAHVARTYIYELLDEGAAPFSHFGLVDAGGNPKPAYVMLKNVIAHLSDPGGTFSVTPLAYSLSGSVHHVLLQRRNGTYVLAVWVEQPEWDVNANGPLSVAPQPVTLAFPTAVHLISSTTFDDAGDASTAPLTPGTTVTIQVTGSPTMVDITK